MHDAALAPLYLLEQLAPPPPASRLLPPNHDHGHVLHGKSDSATPLLITMVVKSYSDHTCDSGPSARAWSVRLPACRQRHFQLGYLLSSAAGVCTSPLLRFCSRSCSDQSGLTGLCLLPRPLLSLAVARASRLRPALLLHAAAACCSRTGPTALAQWSRHPQCLATLARPSNSWSNLVVGDRPQCSGGNAICP